MLFSGQAFQLTDHNGVLELCFDSQNEKVNVFNRTALSELAEVLNVIESQLSARGLVMTSAKSVFVAGASFDCGVNTAWYRLRKPDIFENIHHGFIDFNDVSWTERRKTTAEHTGINSTLLSTQGGITLCEFRCTRAASGSFFLYSHRYTRRLTHWVLIARNRLDPCDN